MTASCERTVHISIVVCFSRALQHRCVFVFALFSKACAGSGDRRAGEGVQGHAKHSRARVLCCIWCNTAVSHLWAHVFGDCEVWLSVRRCAVQACGLSGTPSWDVMFRVLSCTPDAPGYLECLNPVEQVVADAERFWTKTYTYMLVSIRVVAAKRQVANLCVVAAVRQGANPKSLLLKCVS